MNEQIPALEKRGVMVEKDIFADYALEWAVKRAVDKPWIELTQEQLASLSSITELWAGHAPDEVEVPTYDHEIIYDLAGNRAVDSTENIAAGEKWD